LESKNIRQRAEAVKRAVVIGGGSTAMEVAAVLAQKGIEVTMVLRDERMYWIYGF
jgi:NADPH-dependent 2,4-dienoyl-CoA reductase/sulfur reductase-like enzyme